MAQELEDGEFWLPSDFLTDDDDFKINQSKMKTVSDGRLWCGSSSAFNSNLSSPVDSVFGSAETESDDDEFVSGLTRKLALSNNQPKLSSSPQSTLPAFKPEQAPNTVPPRVSSPPPETQFAGGWDSPHSARTVCETAPFSPNPTAPESSVPSNNPNPKTHLEYLRLQAHQQRLMQTTTMKRGKSEPRFPSFRDGEPGITRSPSMAGWPTLQQSQQTQKPKSGMRAVFLGEPGLNKERTGTGVFLPRRQGTDPAKPRNKPACSTVILPERVIRALNLDLDSINCVVAQKQSVTNRGLRFYQDPTR